jgi:DNA repair protein SbcC/Rad50
LVRTPDGVVELQAAVNAADEDYAAAAERERTTAMTSMAADEAIRSGPNQQRLEETLRWRDELEAGTARQAKVEDDARRAAQARSDAAQILLTADRRLESGRADLDAARDRQKDAADAVETVEQRIALLRQAHMPDGVEQLAEHGLRARSARNEADDAVKEAETALSQAIQAVERLPERSALDHLLQALTEYDEAQARADDVREAHRVALTEAAAARERVQALTAQRHAARSAYEDLRTLSVAADLRPRLSIGHTCPVCGQAVAVLPPPLDAPELEAARHHFDDAEARLGQATTAHNSASQQVMVTKTQLDPAFERIKQLEQTLADQLPSRPSGIKRDRSGDRRTVTNLIAQRDRALTRRESAQLTYEHARAGRLEAEQQLGAVEQASSRAWARLHTTRGPLVPLGAPAVADTDLATAWIALSGWAQAQADELTSTDLATARADLDGAAEALGHAEAELREATAARNTAAQALTETAVAAERAAAEHRRLVERLHELASRLVDRPLADKTRELLLECARLRAAAEAARSAAWEAAAHRQQAEQRREASRSEQAKARASLRRSRDGLADLGVPSLDENDLAAAWTELSTWSAAQAEEREARLIEVEGKLATAGEQLDREIEALAANLWAHDIDFGDHQNGLTAGAADAAGQALRVPQLVAVEQERARGRTAEVVGQRRQAADLARKIAADTETQQVAAELQLLMSSKRFPQWLADAALDILVADASASLLRLSNNQFDLTHDRGEFYVIDHTDADSRRSVRTLSGGETFQASLALALALSEELATLAAGGRTTLDSIFLDEGFGTLDPDALEIVAATLENLAQDDRMVGIVTHVGALAERVPVRYEVRRDSRASTITRAGP